MTLQKGIEENGKGWNYIYMFIIFMVAWGILLGATFNLQVVQGNSLAEKSANNQVNVRYIYPNRGVIYDRNGNILAENVPATDLYLNMEGYVVDGDIQQEVLQITLDRIEDIIGRKWQNSEIGEESQYSTLYDLVYAQFIYMSIYPEFVRVSGGGEYTEKNSDVVDDFLTEKLGERWLQQVEKHGEEVAFKVIWRNIEDAYAQYEVQIASNLSNTETIDIKSVVSEIAGLRLDESSKRHYPGGEAFSHVIGYTSGVTYEDWVELDYVGLNDTVGRLGVERVYDEKLIGTKGMMAYEVDAYGSQLTEGGRVVKDAVSGDSLYLTIDKDAQERMYELLAEYVGELDAAGGAGIIQDVDTGELVVLASYPSYDNADFIEGLSEKEYEVLADPVRTPLLNRAIGAQLPPGSTYKTLVAASALDSGAITTGTVYVSKRGYEFSNGAGFQEYHNHSYGPLNVVNALAVSSNIFFCETIRNWDIEELVPYFEAFGIGSRTGIDLLGEGAGRLPSPENKIALANTPGVTWLDPLWYPEGDGCNTVIGQGVTLVTPLQMSNWVSAIANGGTLHTPHVAKEFLDGSNGEDREGINFSPLNTGFISGRSLSIVRSGMREAAGGSRSTMTAFRGLDVKVAAKTGTAEFGALNAQGIYEHTHAWVTGFYPYDNPKYAFTILLEDGGESYNSAELASDFVEWWSSNR